jgi:hypothetical protein
MSKFHVAHAVGKRMVAGCGPEPVEAVHIAGFGSLVSLDEALAMGTDVKRVAWLDSTLSDGREMVRYSDLSLGGREKAEANGFSVEPMPKHVRERVEREKARRAADDAAFAAARKQRSGPKAATLDKPHSNTPSPSPEPEPLSAYEAAILALDEARVRPSAARTLLRMHQGESTLSIPDAAALLAALPFETHAPIEAPTMSHSHPAEEAKAHSILVRATELRQQGLSMRAARGDAEARAEALRLDTALRMSRTRGTNIVAELTNAGADVAPIAEQARRVAAA